MKKISIYIAIIFLMTVFLAGCSLKESAIQPGKEVVKRPGSSEPKPVPGDECKFSIVQKTDKHPIIKEQPAGDNLIYEDEIINRSKTKSMNFTIKILEGIISIKPDSFSLKSGESQVIEIEFDSQTNQFSSVPTSAKEIKHSYKITSDCNNESKDIIFYTTVIAPYNYSLYLPANPINQLKKGATALYVYKITNLSNYYREIRILNSKFNEITNVVGIPAKSTRYINYRFFMAENAITNKAYTYVLYFDFGYTKSNWGGPYFYRLLYPQKVEFSVIAVD